MASNNDYAESYIPSDGVMNVSPNINDNLLMTNRVTLHHQFLNFKTLYLIKFWNFYRNFLL